MKARNKFIKTILFNSQGTIIIPILLVIVVIGAAVFSGYMMTPRLSPNNPNADTNLIFTDPESGAKRTLQIKKAIGVTPTPTSTPAPIPTMPPLPTSTPGPTPTLGPTSTPRPTATPGPSPTPFPTLPPPPPPPAEPG